MGSRDRLPLLDQVRSEPVFPDQAPPFETLVPLAQVVAVVKKRKSIGTGVLRAVEEMVGQLGLHERGILTETTAADLMRVMPPEIAEAILAQRTGAISRRPEPGSGRLGQGAFGF
jgi:PHP family Zn ribbon phosphoesterase